MLDHYPDILTVKQLATIFGIGINSAYAIIHTEQIKSCRIGRKILIPKQCVIDYLDSIRYTGMDDNDDRLPTEEVNYDG